jgi:hypothetical protein
MAGPPGLLGAGCGAPRGLAAHEAHGYRLHPHLAREEGLEGFGKKLPVLPVASLLADAIERIHDGRSVSHRAQDSEPRLPLPGSDRASSEDMP